MQIGLQAEGRDLENLVTAIAESKANIDKTRGIISTKEKAHRHEVRDIEQLRDREAQKPEMAKRAVEK